MLAAAVDLIVLNGMCGFLEGCRQQQTDFKEKGKDCAGLNLLLTVATCSSGQNSLKNDCHAPPVHLHRDDLAIAMYNLIQVSYQLTLSVHR